MSLIQLERNTENVRNVIRHSNRIVVMTVVSHQRRPLRSVSSIQSTCLLEFLIQIWVSWHQSSSYTPSTNHPINFLRTFSREVRILIGIRKNVCATNVLGISFGVMN